MKKVVVYFGIFFVVAYGTALTLRWFSNRNVPKFYREQLKILQSNSVLMDSIGGYHSFRYSWDKLDLKKDSVEFEIEIRGIRKTLICKGTAIKENSIPTHWRTKNIKNTIY